MDLAAGYFEATVATLSATVLRRLVFELIPARSAGTESGMETWLRVMQSEPLSPNMGPALERNPRAPAAAPAKTRARKPKAGLPKRAR
jgi:hypothetical protein